MSTVANRYYNSPWLEGVGRNLASALAPTDPDVLRQREQNQFEFDYLKKKAGYEEIDRAGDEEARGALGELHKLRANPIYKMDAGGKPLTGKDGKPVVDSDAMDKRAYELAGIVEAKAKDRYIRADLEPAMYEASSKFRRQQLVQKFAAGYAAELAARRHDYRNDEIYTQGGVNSVLQDQQDAAAMQRLQVQGAQKLAEWQTRINAATKNGKPLTITQGLVDAVGLQIIKQERVAGHKLSDAERLQYTGEAVALLQATGDPVNAAMRVWAAHGLGGPGAATREEPEFDSIINHLMKWIDPNFDPVSSPVGQTEDVLKSDPAAPAPTDDTTPRDLGTAATTEPRVNPIQARGDAERGMEQTTRDRMRAETAAIKNKVTQPAATRRPPSVPKDPSKRKPLDQILGR